jgi:hypothetical protein
MTLDDVKMLNCADCGAELLGESMADLEGTRVSVSHFRHGSVVLPPLVRGRIDGRPYCRACFRQRTRRPVS